MTDFDRILSANRPATGHKLKLETRDDDCDELLIQCERADDDEKTEIDAQWLASLLRDRTRLLAAQLPTTDAECEEMARELMSQYEADNGPWVEIRSCMRRAAALLRRPRTADAAEMRVGSSVEGWLEETQRVAAEMRERCAQLDVPMPIEYAKIADDVFQTGFHAGRFAYQAAIRALPLDTEHSRAETDIIAERRRQIEVEGWTAKHDDEHTSGELASAAACYALPDHRIDVPVWAGHAGSTLPVCWPDQWDESWWKPTNRRRDLVKAGALIIAEIERLDRAASPVRDTEQADTDEIIGDAIAEAHGKWTAPQADIPCLEEPGVHADLIEEYAAKLPTMAEALSAETKP